MKVFVYMPTIFSTSLKKIVNEENKDISYSYYSNSMSNDEVKDLFLEADAVVWSSLKINEEWLQESKKLKLIQKWGSGLDGINKSILNEKSIELRNVPNGNSISVAEHALTLMLAASKRVINSHTLMKKNNWCQDHIIEQGTYELFDKKVLIIGFGNIGKYLSKLLNTLGMRVFYNKRNLLSAEYERDLNVKYRDLDDKLDDLDYLVICASLNSESRGLINNSLLAKLNKKIILINVSRGSVINEEDMYEFLLENQKAIGCFDVFNKEPLESNSPFVKLHNCILTPHVAGRSKEAMNRMSNICLKNVKKLKNKCLEKDNNE